MQDGLAEAGGRDISPEVFDAGVTPLREALLDAQFDLAEQGRRTLLILLNGPDGSGKGKVLNRLHEWLDPRTLKTLAFDIARPEKPFRPLPWRYWNEMPARGRIGIVLGSWYHQVLLDRATGEMRRRTFLEEIADINRDEAMLAAEGVGVLKIWLQAGDFDPPAAGPREQPGSLRNPLTREWTEINTRKEKKALVSAAQELLEATGETAAPWHFVDATFPHRRDLEVGRLVKDALLAAVADKPARRSPPARTARRITRGPDLLKALDLTRDIDAGAYETALSEARSRIFELTQSRAFRKKRALVAVFEGNDAAGKGGVIRRLRGALNPITSQVHPIAAPTDEELARPYLWRFWRRVPARGHVAIFDRSWYGRVLVERVEGFAAPADWRRAYDEINAFEEELTDAGYLVAKFWLAIDKDEQLARFEARKQTPYKRFKITDDDWRNRDKWDHYAAAVEDMVALTSTAKAPWTLVESNHKRYSRIKVLEGLVEQLEAAVG